MDQCLVSSRCPQVLGVALTIALGCSTATNSQSDGGAAADACRCNGDSVNLDLSGGGAMGTNWIACQYKPSCSFVATSFDAYTDSKTMAIFSDGNGQPGPALVASAALGPVSGRANWSHADLPATNLDAGSTYWLAVANSGGGLGGTKAPLAPYPDAGATMVPYSGGDVGNWTSAGRLGAFVFSISGTCR